MRLQEPYYFEGMEIYSTALWHLQKEVELSALAQELSDLDKNSPQVHMYLRYSVQYYSYKLRHLHDTLKRYIVPLICAISNFL